MDDSHSTLPHGQELLADLRELICAARSRMHRSINAELTLLYWRIGRRIHVDQMAGQRARYGEVLFTRIAKALSAEFGTSFGEKSLRRMVQFSIAFADEQIVVSLIRQLSWTHFIALIPLADPLKRDFYAQMAATEGWSVRTLRQRVDSMLYERTALSSQPEQTIAEELAALRGNQQLSPGLVLRDPYVLDFLGLKDSWDEQDLETAILREMQGFLLELGTGFSFVARQKRIQIDGDDFHLDLLFYNRRLRRLIAIELKIGEFKPAYKGQMELYLRWLDRYEREDGEQTPLGIILCTGKKAGQIELLELDRSGIHVAEYLTSLPSREVLKQRLQTAMERARQQLQTAGPASRRSTPRADGVHASAQMLAPCMDPRHRERRDGTAGEAEGSRNRGCFDRPRQRQRRRHQQQRRQADEGAQEEMPTR